MKTIKREEILHLPDNITKAILFKNAHKIVNTGILINQDHVEINFTVNGIEIPISDFDEIINQEILSYQNKLMEKYSDVDKLVKKQVDDKLTDILSNHVQEYVDRLNSAVSNLEALPYIVNSDTQWKSSDES